MKGWQTTAITAGAIWVAFMFGRCGAETFADELAEERTERARLVLDSLGFETALVEAGDDAAASLRTRAEAEDSIDVMARKLVTAIDEIRLLQGEVLVAVEMTAALEVQLQARATVFSDSLTAAPDSAVAEIEDPTFSGHIVYRFLPSLFDITLGAELAIGQTIAEAPDGRLLFGLVPEDDRITLRVQTISWDPPDPEQYCSLGTRLMWGLGGTGLGYILSIATP